MTKDKDISVYLRMSRVDYQKLVDLAQATVRNKSDMIRFLIQEKHDRMFGCENAASEAEPAQSAPVQ
jgi:predicted DNA-binding protein